MGNLPPPAPKGNKRATKLKDPGVRQEAYKQYCNHIASGFPKEAFFFDHGTDSVCWRTIDRYIAENPTEFQPILMEKAQATRYKHWFDEGHKLMKGSYKGGSPVVWQTIMRNIFKDYGWDRETVSEANKTHVIRLAESIRNGNAIDDTEDSNSTVE